MTELTALTSKSICVIFFLRVYRGGLCVGFTFFVFGMESLIKKIADTESKLLVAESENDKNRIERLENLLLEYNIEKNRLMKGFFFFFCSFVSLNFFCSFVLLFL